MMEARLIDGYWRVPTPREELNHLEARFKAGDDISKEIPYLFAAIRGMTGALAWAGISRRESLDVQIATYDQRSTEVGDYLRKIYTEATQ